MSTTGRTNSASTSASTAVTSASSFSTTTTTIPRLPGLSLAESQNHGHIDNHYGDGEHGTRRDRSNLIQDNSSLDPVAGGRGNSNPLSLQLQLQQIILQQTQQRQLAWLHLWQTDRAKALTSDRLHELDRQELGQWLVWKKREKARRLRELRRKRLEIAARQQMEQQQGREEAQVDGQGMTSSIGSSTQQRRPQEEEDREGDLRGREIRNATSRTHSRTRSESGPVMRGIGFDTDDGVLLSDSSDYEASDDETPLMKLVSRTCGQWIQVINLQQEMPYHQRVMTQSFMQHPATPARGTTLRSRTIQLLQQQQRQEEQQQDLIGGGGGRYGILGSVFQYLTRQQTPGTPIGAASEPERLLSRRDFVNDWTVKTIVDHCPGLCKLTLSECQDFAGCYQISDKGLTPLLKQCGSRLLQLRVSDCDNITSASVVALANHCPNTEWLDLCRTGALTEECLILLAERCTDLEWLNLARVSPGVPEPPLEDGLGGGGAEGDNTNNGDTGGGIDSDINGGPEIEQDHDEEVIDVDNEKTSVPSDGDRLVKEETSAETENQHQDQEEEEEKVKEDSITDRALALLCESCPNLQLLDLSYISTISNTAMESLSETAKSLVCLTIIGCPGITSQSLLYLARLRNSSGKLGCITMGDALGISERDIEQIMQGMLSGWQKSLVDETNLGEILGRSWDE
ncbi:hypothetical protein EC957_010018 [Mortierella hygrophila]|uniref:Uncharacterized protein n=1 Tax=Mortierella hygrophila TaxID=979708 RepID=A0A9P6K8N0_9FUNG|nr:hypothetical protein EC957_010018 [Mortierella hygrophila]